MTTLIFGYGGNGNFGDDLLLVEWLKKYSKAGRSVVAVSQADWMIPIFMGDPMVEFSGWFDQIAQRELKKLKGSKKLMGKSLMIEAGKKAAQAALSTQGPWRNILTDLDGIHFIGGGYLNEKFERSWLLVTMLAKLGKSLGIPVSATGQGLMPPLQDTAISHEVFSMFSVIECRDTESYDYLNNLKLDSSVQIVSGLDDSFISPVKVPIGPVTNGETLAVCIQGDLGGTQIFENTLTFLQSLWDSQRFKRIIYLSLFDSSDMKFYSILKEKLPVDAVYKKDMLLENGLPLNSIDFVVSSRFHLHLLAARRGIKGSYVVTNPGYYDIKHQSVTGLGSGWSILGSPNTGSKIPEKKMLRMKSDLISSFLK